MIERWNRWAAGLVPLVVGVVVLAGCSSASPGCGRRVPGGVGPAGAGPGHRGAVPGAVGAPPGSGLALPPVTGRRPPPPPRTAAGYVPSRDWPTYHGDVTRSGYVAALARTPPPRLVAWQAALDGKVYCEPGRPRGGMVVAATEGGSLYGLDAHDRRGAVAHPPGRLRPRLRLCPAATST